MSKREAREREVVIDVGRGDPIRAQLHLPPVSLAVVVMLCDGGARSDAERLIAQALQADGCATLRLQLSSERGDAEASATPRGNIELLAARLVAVTEWLSQNPDLQTMNIGYFASGTASAAVFLAAARAPDYIDAIVTVGGRPDLAGDELEQVRAATLLLTIDHGANLALHRKALPRLRTEKRLAHIPSRAFVFDDPAALEQVAQLSSRWFVHHLMSGSHSIPA